MKKTLAVLLAGILCAGMLAACGSSAPTSNQSNPAEAGTAAEAGAGEERTFTVGFDAEYPPYGFKDEKSGAGRWSSSPSTGIPRIWNLAPALSTASGTA